MKGLYNTFMENFPITDEINFCIEFLIILDPPRYTIQCIERAYYSVPLKARLKLYCTDRTRRF
jgi:DNA-directed RNA polymerase subunit beta